MIGKRIYETINRPSAELVNKFDGMAAANVADCMGRIYATDATIKSIGRNPVMLGTALTVHAALSDNLLFHKALLMAQPGDVIVVNSCGDMIHSICGEQMYRYAVSKGVKGFLIDGCVRDIDYLKENDFPVFACGTTPAGPYKNGPGEINVDVAIGGQVVHPGDIILGDSDGVVVIPPKDAEEIIEKVKALKAGETSNMELIRNGKWADSKIAKGVEATIAETFEIVK